MKCKVEAICNNIVAPGHVFGSLATLGQLRAAFGIRWLVYTYTEEVRPAMRPVIASDDFGLGSLNNQVYADGLQLVINLSSRQLTQAENSLHSKGLPFCPTPSEIDVYALRKDVLDFVRRIRLKEYFYLDDAN